ncbi:class I SAM-dependent methyltransferase [bacterium]|nr:class I SAM-dependent methyltransferase [bacterium]
MAAQSKAWNWTKVTDDIWTKPSEDVYYYVNRWRSMGFNKFLDLGCGLGRHSILFAESGFETDAFDLSQDGLDILNEKASERGLSIKIAKGDINSLPYNSDTFDCLLAYHVISHTDSQGIAGIVGEIGRVIKNGGEFFVTLCSKNSPSFLTGKYPKIDENTIIKTKEPEVGIPHLYADADGIRQIFHAFEIIKLRQVQDFFDNTSSWHYFVHAKKPY